MSDDRALIRDLVENWVVWRDAGDWERFATVWHDEGFMMATWFQGPATDFIRVSREGFERGVSILHFLGGNSIDLAAKAADNSPRRRRQAPPTIPLRRRRQAPPTIPLRRRRQAPPTIPLRRRRQAPPTIPLRRRRQAPPTIPISARSRRRR